MFCLSDEEPRGSKHNLWWEITTHEISMFTFLELWCTNLSFFLLFTIFEHPHRGFLHFRYAFFFFVKKSLFQWFTDIRMKWLLQAHHAKLHMFCNNTPIYMMIRKRQSLTVSVHTCQCTYAWPFRGARRRRIPTVNPRWAFPHPVLPSSSTTFHLKTTHLTLAHSQWEKQRGRCHPGYTGVNSFDVINLQLFIRAIFFLQWLMYALGFLDIMARASIEGLGPIFSLKSQGEFIRAIQVAHGSFLQVQLEALGW